MRSRNALACAAAVLMLTAAACGDDDDDDNASSATTLTCGLSKRCRCHDLASRGFGAQGTGFGSDSQGLVLAAVGDDGVLDSVLLQRMLCIAGLEAAMGLQGPS